ncbi:unnamed protein product, partial [Ixodes hexagonus]
PASIASELLKWSVLGSLLIGWVELKQKNETSFKRSAPWTFRDVASMLFSIASSAAAIRKGVYMYHEQSMLRGVCSTVHRDALAHIATGLGLAGLSVISSLRQKRGLGASGLICCVLGLLFSATMTDLLTLHQQLAMDQDLAVSDLHYQSSIVLLTGLLAGFTLGCFIFSGLRDIVVYDRYTLKIRKSSDEDTHSPFSVLIATIIYKHMKNTLLLSKTVVADLPALGKRLTSSFLVNKLNSRLFDKGKPIVSQSRFITSILRVLWMDLFWVTVVTFAYYACLIVRIPILESLIIDSSSTQLGALSVLFLATSAGDSLLSCYQLHLSMRFGLRVRSMLQAAIFHYLFQMTRLSPTSRAQYPAGQILSILGVDCTQLSFSIMQFPMPIIGIICSPIVFFMLSTRVGVGPAVSCAAWLLFVLLLPIPTSRIQNMLWRKIMKGRDERLKRMADLLASVRLVKMYAWEDAYVNAVKEVREKEMAPIFRVNLLDGFLDSLFSASSSVMTIILFGVLAAVDPSRILDPALSFSCVYILSLTDMVTNSASLTLRMRSLVSLSMRRITKFCTAAEQETRPSDQKYHTRRKGEVVLEKCSFAWTKGLGSKTEAVLRGISMDVEPGSLVGITGFVGSGKSSLLAALLGDMHLLEGNVRITGQIGYVPQVACIYNMTVRDNIVFGQTFDSVRYGRVLRACELLNDINTFPAGDLTEVGEKGETLSGGQKQRISLARAAYSRCPIYLLDDPLSALDPNVATKVFKQVLGSNGLLKNKTRILVSNQGNLLKHMSLLMLMDRNSLSVYHSLEELLRDERAPKTLSIGMAGQGQRGTADNNTQVALLKHGGSNGKVTKLESLTSSKGAGEVFWAMLRMSGLWLPAAVAFFISSAVALAWQLLWIKQWTEADSPDNNDDPYDPSWVRGLVGLCVGDVLFRCAGGALLAGGNRQMSQSMHHNMLSHVMSSPVSFFDSTPRGRMLNRFSIDLESLDARLYLMGKTCLQNLLLTVARLSVVATQSPVVLAVGGVCAVILVFGMYVIIRASNEVRFVDGARMSAVLQHVTETVDSLSSIRSYGMVERFCEHFYRLADDNMVPFNAFICCYRVSRALASVCGFVIVFSTLVSAALNASAGASSVGLALSSSLSIPMTMLSLCMVLFSCLQIIVSFERALEYTELPSEPDVDIDETDQDNKSRPEVLSILPVDQKWPTDGKLEFQNYATSYRPGILPDVLKGVTFVVQPQEKVGVVGRTGAGKSSLVLALLRVLKSSSGCICIDGVDINAVPLRRLRNAVTVIPQDPSLVRGSLRDNLDPTRSHKDEELWTALREAHLDGFVASQPNGLLMETGSGGSNLSVGQRQLVCLARALIRMPRVLLLDEATSQMDGDTDRLIQATLRESFAGCTLLAIAHRIHTVLDYDKILVMGDGTVLEYGPVDQLLADEHSIFGDMARKAGVLTKQNSFRNDALLTEL